MDRESLQYQFPETLNQQKRLAGLPTEEAVLIIACGVKGDTELATELSVAARTEREIAAGLSRPVQHDAPERMPPELSHSPSRNIQKER